MVLPWRYPDSRYYDTWYGDPVDAEPSDGEIKAMVVARLQEDPSTMDDTIRVDVKRGVVILTGEVSSPLAKRAAGDDSWDTIGVSDVSNQLTVAGRRPDSSGGGSQGHRRVRDVMTAEPLRVSPRTTTTEAAKVMRAAGVGDVLVVEGTALRGIVTDRDLVVRVLAEGLDPATTPVERVCSEQLSTVSPDETVAGAAHLMGERSLRRLPVVDNGALVGIVSLGDLALEQDPGSGLADISAAPPNT
jgi:CBS domain-containing protein